MDHQSQAPVPATGQSDEFGRSVMRVESTLQRFLGAASVGAAWGNHIEHRNTLIVPAAEVLAILGFGLGTGGSEPTERGIERASGGGGGGGGYVFARPVAALILTRDGVWQESVVDITKLALAVFTTVSVVAGLLFRLLRAPRT